MIDYWRQLDLVSPADLDFDVTVIGAGGLGSPIALALAKMGCPRIALYDGDRVEHHNLPNQLYRLADIGTPKVEALARLLREFVPSTIEAHDAWVSDQVFSGVVISAVDSMSARKTIWERCVRYRAAIPCYVDARLGGEVGRVLTVAPAHPDDVARYEQTLFGDDEGSVESCTAQATIYSAFGIASLVANQVKRHARAEALVFDHVIDFATSTLITDG